ncbi:MAG: hypothetical protein OXB99_06225 [Acidimicrobiaceae bacterium]|nr:hypothetical protein [Acidimicrobiaceae bacterium]
MFQDQTEQEFEFDDYATSGGVYANELYAWCSAHEFTFDFLSPRASPDRDPDMTLVVARIRFPPSAVMRALRQLSATVDRYEIEYGLVSIPPTEAS